MRPATAALAPILAVLAACAADRPASLEKGYSLSAREPFQFEVDRELLREWGGAGSPKFNQVLEEELARRRLCRDGYALRNEGMHERIFRVTVRCRS